MAVLVQEMVRGHAHGTALCTSPGKNGRVLVQCFPAQGATGSAGPGRWVVTGGAIRALPGMDGAHAPGLAGEELLEIAGQTVAAMEVLGSPREIEWALHGNGLFILGARPVRRGPVAPEGRLFHDGAGRGDEMRHLRDLVEKVLIPGLTREADAFSSRSLERLGDGELSAEAGARREARTKWAGLCRDHVMPLAYAAVAFGHMYNDAVRPVEPYEFVDLLLPGDHPALQKDRLLEEMADLARRNAVLLRAIRRKVLPVGFDAFTGLLVEYLDRFGQSSSPSWEARAVLELVLRLAQRPPGACCRRPPASGKLTEEFLAALPGERRACAARLLELARAACRLQGEAGAQLRRIERQEEEALAEERRRLGWSAHGAHPRSPDEPGLENGGGMDGQAVHGDKGPSAGCVHLSARQLAGRPYSSGMASGPARVIRGERDLSGFRAGEIMICDSLEPGMTAIVPLADAVVVEKGAMPREGAAIARKYGLPYVAGVSDATRFIRTGTKVTVDGHLGIVIIEA
jgi:phosphohistidine swiveling domain-containing protein